MSVYAPAPGFVDQRRHTRALLLIVGAHALLIGTVMTAKMAVPVVQHDGPLIIDWIQPVSPPPPPLPTPQPPRSRTPTRSNVDHTSPIVPVSRPTGEPFDQTPTPNPGPTIGPGVDPGPIVIPIDPSPPVRVAARFATPDWLVRPPYPADKQRLEEEATLKLRLSIDERGRVIAVEPMGRADPSFLEAARRHLIAKWRYEPAMEDGRPVPSATVISLTFRIED